MDVASTPVKERCYYDLGTTTVPSLQWSPSGDRVLLGPDRIGRGESIAATGYLPTNPDVKWSAPSGKSLLAATAKLGLVKRNANTAARTDISFLDEHRESVYHPAGKAILSIGLAKQYPDDPDPTLGLWLADNQGGGRKLLVQDESDAKISEPRFNPSGKMVYFLADHGGTSFHIHAYDTDQSQISVIWEQPKQFSALTISPIDDALAVRVGACSPDAITDVEVFAKKSHFPVSSIADLKGLSLSPVGWFSNNTIAVLARAKGCDGPGAVWVIDENRKARKLVDGVSVAATRVQHALPEELSDAVGNQVVA
jgi:dipeptidyl aminopeptidase/acylaminoacyl peptidase